MTALFHTATSTMHLATFSGRKSAMATTHSSCSSPTLGLPSWGRLSWLLPNLPPCSRYTPSVTRNAPRPSSYDADMTKATIDLDAHPEMVWYQAEEGRHITSCSIFGQVVTSSGSRTLALPTWQHRANRRVHCPLACRCHPTPSLTSPSTQATRSHPRSRPSHSACGWSLALVRTPCVPACLSTKLTRRLDGCHSGH